ncbi:MAG: hypothetical protein WC227_04255 [Patescibacteria group bacterium]|jgi:hypothetical protein
MPRKDDCLRTKAFQNLFEGVAALLPEWHDIFDKVVEYVVSHYHPSQSGINEARKSLSTVKNKYGKSIFVEFLKLVNEHIWLTWYGDDIAEYLATGRSQLVHRAIDFRYSHSCIRHHVPLSKLIIAIEQKREDEMERGIALAPRPSDIAEPPVLQKYWDVERAWNDRRGEYCYITLALGYEKTKSLFDQFYAEGFSGQTVVSFLKHIVRSGYYYRNTSAENEAEISLAIDLVRSIGLSVPEFAEITLQPIRSRYGTIAEITQILRYAKEFEVTPRFLGWVFESALNFHRRPLWRHEVVSAFARSDFNHLALLRWGQATTSWGYWFSDEARRKEILRILWIEHNIEIFPAVLEILEEHFRKLGFSSMEILAISSMARNPLFSNDFLNENPPTYKIRNLLKTVFGRQEAIQSLSRIRRELRLDFSGALLRCENDSELHKLLHAWPREKWRIILRSITQFDFERTKKALESIRKESLDLNFFLLSVAGSIRWHDDAPSLGSAWAERIVIAAGDRGKQILIFSQLPYDLRMALKRPIKLYRRIHLMIQWRFNARRV